MKNLLEHPEFDSIAGEYEGSLGLPKGILRSLIYQESRGRVDAVSPVGARGVAQFMEKTAKAYNVDVNDPWDSLRGAAEYLSDNLKKYGTIEAALADYNGGTRAAKAVLAGKPPPFKETQNYIPQILSRLPKETEQTITANIARGDHYAKSLIELQNAGFKEWIDDARIQGASDQEIVEILAPEAAKRGQAARQTVEERGVIGNAWQGAKDRVSDVGMAARQLESRFTGNEEELKREQEEQLQRLTSPERIATDSTTSGKIGSFLPDVALGIATAGAGLPVSTAGRLGVLALEGAGYGASIPTTGDGQLGTQMAIGALAAPAAYGAGRLLSKGGSAAKELWKEGRASAQMDITSPSGQQALAREITARAGNPSDELNSSWVAATKASFDKRYTELFDGVVGQFDDAARTKIDDIVKTGGVPAEYRRELRRLMMDGDEVRTTFPIAQVNTLRKTIGRDLAGDSISAIKRQKLAEINQILDDAVDSAMSRSGKAEAWQQVQKDYQNYKAARNIVGASNDSGNITEEALLQGIKKGRFRSMFEEGKAPLQDIAQGLTRQEPTLSGAAGMFEKALNNPVVDAFTVLPGIAMLRGAARRLLGAVSGSPTKKLAFMQTLTPAERAAVKKVADGAATTSRDEQLAETALAKLSKLIGDVDAGEGPAAPNVRMRSLAERFGRVEPGEEVLESQVKRTTQVNKPTVVDYKWDPEVKAYHVKYTDGSSALVTKSNLKYILEGK